MSITRGTAALASLTAGNGPLYTQVLPAKAEESRMRSLRFDTSNVPCLCAANAIVQNVGYDGVKRQLTCDVRSFDGHRTSIVVAASGRPPAITVDGAAVEGKMSGSPANGRGKTEVVFTGSGRTQHILFTFR